MPHPSVQPAYQRTAESIQDVLKETCEEQELTQSLIELWKFIHQQLPGVRIARAPGYPEYRRELAASLVAVNPVVDWRFTEREDWEYFRLIEHIAKKKEGKNDIVVDVSDYDVRKGKYWIEIWK
jgi:hypothetical protein